MSNTVAFTSKNQLTVEESSEDWMGSKARLKESKDVYKFYEKR